MMLSYALNRLDYKLMGLVYKVATLFGGLAEEISIVEFNHENDNLVKSLQASIYIITTLPKIVSKKKSFDSAKPEVVLKI